MRYGVASVLLAMLLACSGGIEAGEVWRAPPSDAGQRAIWLVQYLTALADAGGVGSRDELPAALHATFTSSHVDQRTYPVMRCSGSLDRVQLDGTWFKDLPGGVAHMSYPGFFINGPGTTGSPVLTYTKSTSTCDTLRLRDTVEISFDNLPGFACVTGDKLVTANPRIKQGYATDGFIVFSYQGKLDQGTSTTLGFTGRYGGPCLISALITRHLEGGYRMFRAQKKQVACRAEVETAFCHGNPPPAPPSSGALPFGQFGPGPPSAALSQWIGRLSEQQQKGCRSLDAYYDAEPADGPEVEQPVFRPGPHRNCGPAS